MTDLSPTERAQVAVAQAYNDAPSVHILRSRRLKIVRAVLEAIREPSEAMIDAGVNARLAIEDCSSAHGCSTIWHAMVDAALAEIGN